MNCSLVEAHLDDYLDQTLDDLQRRQIDEHLKTCDHCENRLAEAVLLMKSVRDLKDLPEAQINEVAKARVWKNVWQIHQMKNKAQNKTGKKQGFIQGFLAASVLVSALFIQQNVQFSDEKTNDQAIAFQLLEEREVYLMFTSEQEDAIAHFTIEIPENFAHRGKVGQRTISWNAKLVKGKNLLTIPLVAQKLGDGVLKANIKIGEKNHSFTVLLNTSKHV